MRKLHLNIGFDTACFTVAVALATSMLAGCGPADESAEPTARETPAPQDARPADTATDNEVDPMRDGSRDETQQHILAAAELGPVDASGVSGNIRFTQRGDLLEISGRVSGLTPGVHGLHIHETGDCSGDGAASAGAHFSPEGHPHGSPQSPDAEHHAGDLGNITADDDGIAEFELVDGELRLGDTEDSIIGRAVIVHAGADDLATRPEGNSGKRVGCAVIDPVLQPDFPP